MSEVLDQKKAAPVLNPQRMALVEQWRQDWVVNIEEGTTIEEVCDNGYWAHMAAQLQPFDRIEARMESGEWTADLIVRAVGRNWAAVHLIAKHNLIAVVEAPLSAKHEVLWRGQQHKWCVKRKADNEVLQANMESKAHAIVWLENYETVVKG